MRTSSRNRASKSTASSSFVTAWSRWARARLACGARASKSRRGAMVVGVMVSPYSPSGPPVRSTWMAESRATFGVELPVDLTGRPKRAGLEHELREAVREGRLAPGTRLPSSRTLAKDLAIARNSVADAYGQLVAEGWFVTRHGAGTWVAGSVGSEAAAERVADPPRERFDLRPGVPDLGAFPRSAWLAAARRALAVAADDAFGYGDPRGLRVLREALAEYLVRARRVLASPERIVVCAGFAQGLELLCAVLRNRGARSVALEAYGHALHRGIVEGSGL